MSVLRVFLLFLLLSVVGAKAQPCDITTDCPSPFYHTMTTQTANVKNLSGSVLYATQYGVTANGTTSDDVALKAAIDACAAIGSRLILPPGNILLTGVVTTTIRNCAIEGADIPATSSQFAAHPGTLIKLTATGSTAFPFILGYNFGIKGITFYHPNQTTGAVVYPAIFTDDTTTAVVDGHFDNVTIVNAYDGFRQQNGAIGWGNLHFTNCLMFAVHRMFDINTTGDGFTFTGVRFSPGGWIGLGASNAVLNTASSGNTIFYINAGNGVNLNIVNTLGLSQRYGIYVAAGGNLSESEIDMTWDAVATIVDTHEAGSNWAPNSRFTGVNASCQLPNWGGAGSPGNAPCFNLGASGEFLLDTFKSAGSIGSFLITAGMPVHLIGVTNDSIGGAFDGPDYYVVYVSAGSPEIIMQNSRFQGIYCGTHVGQCDSAHGIGAAAGVTPGKLIVQNNQFAFFHDVMTVPAATTTMITGNISESTNGNAHAGVYSLNLTGTNPVLAWPNYWDLPPQATLVSCGGSGSSVSGGLSGSIRVGNTNPTTVCSFTMPYMPVGAGGALIVQPYGSHPTYSVGESGTLPTWTVTFSSDFHGGVFLFSLLGVQ